MSTPETAAVDTTPTGLVALAARSVSLGGVNPSGKTAQERASWWIRFVASIRSHEHDPLHPTVAGDVRPFVEGFTTAYFSKYPDRKKVNPNTYNALLSGVKSYFRAVGVPVVEAEWAQFRYHRPQPDLRVLTPADVRSILSTAESDDASDTRKGPGAHSRFAVVHTLAHTGLRLSELLHLAPSDQHPGDSELLVRQGKEGRDRLVVCAPRVFDVLSVHLSLHPVSSPDAPIFPMSSWAVERIIHRASYAVDGGQVTAHDLRRTYSNQLREAGVEDRVMDRQLGHAPQGTGNRSYWAPSSEWLRGKLLPVLEGLYRAAPTPSP